MIWFKKTVHIIINYLKELNVYVSTNVDTTEQRRKQLLATRLFIVLFIISLFGLVGYISLSLQLKTVHIQNPSQLTFEQLHSTYPDTLICPCSQTSIQLDKFIHINVSFHQICSSIFVSDEWISSISHLIPQLYYILDIRRMISSQLEQITFQCHSSEVAVKDAIETLGSKQLFIPIMLSRDTLNSQGDIIVGEMKKDMIAEQNQSRRLIQTINQQNQLVSALGSNFMYAFGFNKTQQYYLIKFLKNSTYPPSMGFTGYTDSQLCSCVDSLNCTYPSGIYPTLSGYDSYIYQGRIIPPIISSTQLPNLYVGCMPLESIMESTLECFYSYDCLSILFNTTNIKPLNNNIKSNYTMNTKVRVLIEELFIEDWSNEVDFELLFQECQPTKCTYSYNARGNIAFIITTILSLFGGLLVGLKIIASFLITIFKGLEKILKKIFSKTSLDDQNNQDNSTAPNTKISSLKRIFDKTRDWITEFNLFKHPYNDDHGRRNEILTTRTYILLMIVGIVVIVFYGLIIEHTLTYYIKTPSLKSYRELVGEYPSLTCECQQITSAYSTFISLGPTFHQICSSLYVSDVFLPQFEIAPSVYSLGKFNLRVSVSSYYASGRIACTLIRDTTNQAMSTFLQTIYISNYLTHEDEFQSRMTAVVQNFESLAPDTFNHLLRLILDTTQGNQLLTGSFTNAILLYNISSTTEEDMMSVLLIDPNNPSCSCGISTNSCSLSYGDYCNHTYIPYYPSNGTNCFNPVPGLIISCYIVDGLLVSSSACFYDVDCIKSIIGGFAQNLNIPLDVLIQLTLKPFENATSRFSINSTSAEILNYLGIENWNENIDYESYYLNCKPINCFYTITKHFHIPTIVTIVIGLIGGISVILRILTPNIINLIRRRQRSQINIPWKGQLARKLSELNLFKTVDTDQSIEIYRDQIISTRLYIILWIISILFLSIYTGLSEKIIVVHVDSPSIILVKQLQSQNFNEFTCPCSKITIPFGNFTSFNFTFHQICSSDFISNDWLTELFNFDNDRSVRRGVFSSHFQLLRSFCRSSNTTLVVAEQNFYANQFVSINLLSDDEFNDQIRAFIKEFQTKTINSFRRNLGLIIDITLGNQLMSVYESNWYFIPDPQGNSPIYAKSRFYESGNCSCGSSQSLYCADPLMIGKNTSVLGMFIGCLPLTSLRLSSLKCFYDQNCVDQVKNALNLQNMSMIALNSFQSSQYSINTTLDDIIDKLMLEDWTNDVNYSGYFNGCNPQQCSYSVIKKNNALVIFTTLLGLYGGLTITLNFIAPTIVKIGRKVYNKYQSNRRTDSE